MCLGRPCKTRITMIASEIKLGDGVRSSVSGFEGTVTAVCEYLHDGFHIRVTLPETINGETKHEWFDPSELELV